MYEQPNPEQGGEKAIVQGGGQTPGAALNDASYRAPVHPFYGTLKLACLPSAATQEELRQAAKVLLQEIQPTASVFAVLLPGDGDEGQGKDAKTATALYDEIFAFRKRQGLRFEAQRIAERQSDILMPCYQDGKLVICRYTENRKDWLQEAVQVQLAACLCGWGTQADFLCAEKGIHAVGRFSYTFCSKVGQAFIKTGQAAFDTAEEDAPTAFLRLECLLDGESEKEPQAEQTSLVARELQLAWNHLADSPVGAAVAQRMGVAALALPPALYAANPAGRVDGFKPLKQFQAKITVIQK